MLTAACYTWGRIPGLISTFVISVPWKLGSSTSLRRLEPCCQGLQHTKGGTQARAGLQPLQHSKAAAVIGPSLWLLSLFGANSCKVCQSIRKYLFPPHLIPTPTNLPIYKGQSTTTLPEKPKWEMWGVEGVNPGLQSNHWESSGMKLPSQDWGGWSRAFREWLKLQTNYT